MVKQSIDDRCPACGGPVGCGMAKGEPTCWCVELPHAMPMPPAASAARCYCRTCLQKLIDDPATVKPSQQ